MRVHHAGEYFNALRADIVRTSTGTVRINRQLRCTRRYNNAKFGDVATNRQLRRRHRPKVRRVVHANAAVVDDICVPCTPSTLLVDALTRNILGVVIVHLHEHNRILLVAE